MYKVKANNWKESILITMDGKRPKLIKVVINPENIVLSAKTAEKEMKKMQSALEKDFSESNLLEFKKAVGVFFSTVLGERNYKEILDYYDGNIFAVVHDISPWINEVVTPKLHSGFSGR